MATKQKRQKVVLPGKQAKMPKEYPVDGYPYMAIQPGMLKAEDYKYYRSHTEAISKLRSEVETLQHQFRHLSEDIRQNCTEIISELGKLSRDGGELDMLVDPYTGVRYRLKLVRRQAA